MVRTNWLPIVVFALLMAALAALSIMWLGSRLFAGDFAFERVVLFWGTLTGTLSTGLALLRAVDPEFKTPAASDYLYASALTFFLVLPLILVSGFPALAYANGNRTLYLVTVAVLLLYVALVAAAHALLCRRDRAARIRRLHAPVDFVVAVGSQSRTPAACEPRSRCHAGYRHGLPAAARRLPSRGVAHPPARFAGQPRAGELGDQPVAMVALDLDRPVPHRSPGAATALQVGGQLGQFGRVERQAGDHRHAAALAAPGLPSDPHRPRCPRAPGAPVAGARAARHRAPAGGTQPPFVAGVDKAVAAATARAAHCSTCNPR